MRSLRIDAGELRPARRMADGRLIVEGRLTRSGVFTYRNADGSARREYRPPDEVFRADALESFAGAPVTDDHPAALLTIETMRQHAVGAVGENVRRDGDHIIASISVFDAATIKRMDAGKVQLSCGYDVDIEMTPGVTPDGERYDAIQRNIVGNHVALVDVGRAGPSARVRMDAWYNSENEEMMTLEQALSALADAQKEVGAAAARADEATKVLDATRAEVEAQRARADSEKSRADAAEKARMDSLSGEAERVRARVRLEATCAKILGDTFRADMSDRDLKIACVKRVDGDDVAADAHDIYVDGRFDGATKRSDIADASLAATRTAVVRSDAAPDAESAAKTKMIADMRDAWKGQE